MPFYSSLPAKVNVKQCVNEEEMSAQAILFHHKCEWTEQIVTQSCLSVCHNAFRSHYQISNDFCLLIGVHRMRILTTMIQLGLYWSEHWLHCCTCVIAKPLYSNLVCERYWLKPGQHTCFYKLYAVCCLITFSRASHDPIMYFLISTPFILSWRNDIQDRDMHQLAILREVEKPASC